MGLTETTPKPKLRVGRGWRHRTWSMEGCDLSSLCWVPKPFLPPTPPCIPKLPRRFFLGTERKQVRTSLAAPRPYLPVVRAAPSYTSSREASSSHAARWDGGVKMPL